MEEHIKIKNQVNQTPKKEWIKPELELIKIKGGPMVAADEVDGEYHIRNEN